MYSPQRQNTMAFRELLKTTLDNSIPLKIDITCSVKRFNYAAQQAAWMQRRSVAIQKFMSNTHWQSKKK